MWRHVRLEGNFNLRDLGGYAGRDGQLVRTGCVYRSDALCSLTETDGAIVAGLGIRVVFDLRNDHERAARPSRIPDGVEVLERASPSGGGDVRTLEEQIAAGELPDRDDELMATVYVDLLDRLRPELAIILERAVHAPERPLLFHCAAGKDRTGLVAAVLLGLLGVPDETILDDYELTSACAAPLRLEAMAALLAEYGVEENRVLPLLQARRPVLASALRHIATTWGGFEGYVGVHLGLRAELPERLRAALLVAP